MERAVNSVLPLHLEKLDVQERLDIARKALETVLMEAVHW